MTADDAHPAVPELVYIDGILVAASTTDYQIKTVGGAVEPESEDELVGGVIERLQSDVPRLGHAIRHFCELIHDSVKSLRAEEIEAEFSIGVRGSTGVPFVTNGGAEAIVRVKATWTKPSP
jgi:hypothetical protein